MHADALCTLYTAQGITVMNTLIFSECEIIFIVSGNYYLSFQVLFDDNDDDDDDYVVYQTV